MKRKIFVITLIFFLFVLPSCTHAIESAVGEILAVVNWDDITDSAGDSGELAIHLPNNLNPIFIDDLDTLKGAPVYTLEITLNQDGEIFRIGGSQQVVFTNQERVALDAIYFKLIPNFGGDYLAVSDVAVNGQKVEPRLEFENTVMRVDLPAALKPGNAVTITMRIDAVVPSEMGGNYGLFVFMDHVLALDAFFPIIPVYNDEGWNVESPPQNADLIFSDASFFSVTVDAPEAFVIAAGGQEVERVTDAGRQILTYEAGPQRDFYLAASLDFVTESAWVDGVKVTSYFPAPYREAGEDVLETAQFALGSFNQRFGPYPFTELDLVSAPMRAGGMEYSSITALGLYLYDPALTLDGGLPGSVFLESAVAHEIAHMWFYSQVMNDQIDHPWQDESLVQFATYLYYLDRYGNDEAERFKASFYDRWDRINREPISVGLPASSYDGSKYSAIIYGHGPLMFNALRDAMGESAFDQFLKEYVAQYRWQIVEPQDLLDAAENACACDLSPIFREYGLDD